MSCRYGLVCLTSVERPKPAFSETTCMSLCHRLVVHSPRLLFCTFCDCTRLQRRSFCQALPGEVYSHREVRFVCALDHSPTTTIAKEGEMSLMQFIHIRTARSCDELLPSPFVPGRRSRMARRKRSCSQFRAPLPACALPFSLLRGCCVCWLRKPATMQEILNAGWPYQY